MTNAPNATDHADATLFGGAPVPMAKWGRDHWTTLLYLETCLVDRKGVIDHERMRTSPKNPIRRHTRGEYPTVLNDGSKLFGHDDWACLWDAEYEDLVVSEGTGLNPAYRLTERGWAVVGELRRWKADGKGTMTFQPKETL